MHITTMQRSIVITQKFGKPLALQYQKKLQSSRLGVFTNYVDKILPIIDHLPTTYFLLV